MFTTALTEMDGMVTRNRNFSYFSLLFFLLRNQYFEVHITVNCALEKKLKILTHNSSQLSTFQVSTCT